MRRDTDWEQELSLTSLLMVLGFSTDIIRSAARKFTRMLVTSVHRVFRTCLAMWTWVSSAGFKNLHQVNFESKVVLPLFSDKWHSYM